MPIHELADLPALRLETDEGFGDGLLDAPTLGSALGWRLGFYRNPKNDRITRTMTTKPTM